MSFFFCRKSTRRRSRSSTVWRRTFPRTLSRDTSCFTSPETEPASGKSPTDCHSTEGGGTHGCHRLRPVRSHKYPGFIPCRRSFALERHSDWLRRVQVACQPPGLTTVQMVWAHTAKTKHLNKTKRRLNPYHSLLCTGASATPIQEADIAVCTAVHFRR